jgi:hypothetical protein
VLCGRCKSRFLAEHPRRQKDRTDKTHEYSDSSIGDSSNAVSKPASTWIGTSVSCTAVELGWEERMGVG